MDSSCNAQGRLLSMPVLVDELWRVAFTADTPKRRRGRPRKVVSVSDEPEDCEGPPEHGSGSAEADPAATAEATASEVQDPLEAAVPHANGGVAGSCLPKAPPKQVGSTRPSRHLVRTLSVPGICACSSMKYLDAARLHCWRCNASL
jgi:hypothetical protein